MFRVRKGSVAKLNWGAMEQTPACGLAYPGPPLEAANPTVEHTGVKSDC
jgi:hypothetical protein